MTGNRSVEGLTKGMVVAVVVLVTAAVDAVRRRSAEDCTDGNGRAGRIRAKEPTHICITFYTLHFTYPNRRPTADDDDLPDAERPRFANAPADGKDDDAVRSTLAEVYMTTTTLFFF